MPVYTTLPSEIQTVLAKKAGAKIEIEVIYDPDGLNLLLTGKYSIADMSPVSNMRDLDPDYAYRPTMQDIAITFHDPDGYFNPTSSSSPFYNVVGELDRDHAVGATSIKLLGKSGVSFSTAVDLLINDGTNSETVRPTAFTAATGATYYHEITCAALTYAYDAGTRIYPVTAERKELLIRIHFPNTTTRVTVFRGVILRAPECSAGKATVYVTDFKKQALDQPLRSADSGTDKIKRIDTSGDLSDSVAWSTGAGGTLDRADIQVLTDCIPTEWTIAFSDGDDFTLTNRDLSIGMASKTGLYMAGALSGTSAPLYFLYIYDVWVQGNYAFICTGGSVSPYSGVTIVDISDLSAPRAVSTISGAGSPNYMQYAYACCANGQYLYVASILPDDRLTIWDISDVANPSITGSLGGFFAAGDVYIDLIYKDEYIYLTSLGNDSLYVIDVSDPTAPVLTTTITGAGAPNYMGGAKHLAQYGDYLYVITEDDAGFAVVDISTPASANVVGHYTATGIGLLSKKIDAYGDYVYYLKTNGYLIICDVSDPTTPTKVGEISGTGSPNYLDGAFDVKYRDGRVYVTAANDDALVVFDVSDPTVPTLLGSITGAANYLDNAWYFQLWGDYAVIGAQSSNALTFIRISTSDTSIVGNENIRIPADAWGGTPAAGETVIFATAISWADTNPVEIIRQLYETYAEIDSKYIDRSSYFGDRNVGTLRRNYAAAETAIEVTVSVPMYIKTGETLTITEGSTSEDVTVATGVAATAKYPPYISLVVSALANSYTSAATVAWKERAALDTDFSFDAEYNYCTLMSYEVSISLDRTMSVLQAIEEVSKHSDGIMFSDNWGVEKIFTARPHYYASLSTIAKDTNLALPVPSLETEEMINEFTVLYGYNYATSEFLYELTYPSAKATNPGYIRHGFIRNRTITLPGVWTETAARNIAAHKYYFWENGLTLASFNTTVQGLVFAIGDRFTIDTDNPAFDTEVEIAGVHSYKLLGDVSLGFVGYDSKFLYNNYFILGSSGIGTGDVLW